MSGKFFVKKNGVNVDLTTLFQPEGTNNNTYYPDLDISNTAKGDDVAYARPDDFGYKIKDANGTITDLSEYCVINPEYFPDSTNVNVSTYNSMSGYIVGGSGGGGGGSGGVFDNTWLSNNDYYGRDGAKGGAGEVKWFADISLQGVNNINIVVGNGGDGGGGGNGEETSGGWSGDGGNGDKGNSTVIYKGNTTDTATNELVKSLGGNGGNRGNRVSTGGNRGNAGNAGTCGGHGETHQEHNDTTNSFTTTINWSTNYIYLPLVKDRAESETLSERDFGTRGGNKGNAGGYNLNNDNGNDGGDGGDGQKGYAVLYLKR